MWRGQLGGVSDDTNEVESGFSEHLWFAKKSIPHFWYSKLHHHWSGLHALEVSKALAILDAG